MCEMWILPYIGVQFSPFYKMPKRIPIIKAFHKLLVTYLYILRRFFAQHWFGAEYKSVIKSLVTTERKSIVKVLDQWKKWNTIKMCYR